jgi:integrase
MANLGKKNGIYHVRFRYQACEFKKSLKVRDRAAAEAARNLVELTIHRILTGQLAVPDGVDPGEFIVGGGTVQPKKRPPEAAPAPELPSIAALVGQYLEGQRHLLAESYRASQALHLRHLLRHLGGTADAPCDRVGFRDLDAFLKERLARRHANTAKLERVTLLQFYKWVVAQGHLAASPAAALPPIKGGAERPPFRTIAEVERILARGGLTDKEALDLWECLYLAPEEIARLLTAVRANALEPLAFMLHCLPAYTGMRRGEVLRLRWLDVDLDEGYLMARSRKQSRAVAESLRRIDMNPELRVELATWRDQRPRGQLVVCEERSLAPLGPDRANRLFWAPMNGTEWCLDRGRHWYKVGFHTYRHSFASNLAALGVDQRVIDEWMGHQTEAMRRRYRHLFPKDRRAAISCFSFASGSTNGGPASGPA